MTPASQISKKSPNQRWGLWRAHTSRDVEAGRQRDSPRTLATPSLKSSEVHTWLLGLRPNRSAWIGTTTETSGSMKPWRMGMGWWVAIIGQCWVCSANFRIGNLVFALRFLILSFDYWTYLKVFFPLQTVPSSNSEISTFKEENGSITKQVRDLSQKVTSPQCHYIKW